MKHTITCIAFKPLRRNTLLGFASIRIDELKLVISEIAIHDSHGRQWAALPSRPWVQNGQVVKGDDGKIKYQPICEFDNRETRDAFSAAVVRAVLAYAPDAFAAAEAQQ